MDNRGAPGNYTGRLSDDKSGATEFPQYDVATLNRVFQQAPPPSPSGDPITETPAATPPKKSGLRWLFGGLAALGLGGMFLAFRKRKDASKK